MTKWMPPLPDKYPGEVKQWMLDYAIAAVEAYKASLKPVAWYRKTDRYTMVDLSPHVQESVPLYRLDGGDDDAA